MTEDVKGALRDMVRQVKIALVVTAVAISASVIGAAYLLLP